MISKEDRELLTRIHTRACDIKTLASRALEDGENCSDSLCLTHENIGHLSDMAEIAKHLSQELGERIESIS